MSKREKYEDISSSSKPSGFKEKAGYMSEKIKIFFMRNHRRNLKAVLSVVICLVLVVVAMGGAYLRKILSLIKFDPGTFGNPNATFEDNQDYDENLSFATISDVGASSIKEYSRNWALNGDKLYSKYVVNVLLIGEDGTDDDTFLRSDTMMIASVNTKTKQITLCSLMRDSYTYMNIDGDDRYDKINAAYAWGGASKLMEVISNDLKIKLDRYVSINFNSFAKVINLLGGIDVPVTEKEAEFMNRTTHLNDFVAGEKVHLNGEKALIYARIRKLDSDIERTRRQRNVIEAAVKKVKASSVSDINNLIETFLPYVTTNYKTSEIVSLGTQALSGGWQNFEMKGLVEPGEESRLAVNNFQTYTGKAFVWIVDYTLVAHEVQLAMYGNTNIEIGDNHVSPIDMADGDGGTTSYYQSTRNYYYSYQQSQYQTTTRRWYQWTRQTEPTYYYSETTGLKDRLSSAFSRENTTADYQTEAPTYSPPTYTQPVTEPSTENFSAVIQ